MLHQTMYQFTLIKHLQYNFINKVRALKYNKYRFNNGDNNYGWQR